MNISTLIKKILPQTEIKGMSVCQDLPSYSPSYSDQKFALEGYTYNPIIYKCVRLISDLASNLELDAYVHERLVSSSSFLQKLKQPNNFQNKQSFLDELITYDRIYGNAYVLVTLSGDEVTSLRCLNPQSIRIIMKDNYKYVHQYQYLSGINETTTFRVDPVTGVAKYKNNHLLHLKTVNPLKPHSGLSPIHACAVAGDLYNYGLKWNTSLLKNAAKPSGILKTSTTLLDQQYIRLKEQIRSFFQGANNIGNIPILENGLEFQPMSLSPTDMDFLNTLKLSQEIIANVYNIPLPLISNDKSSYNNMVEAKRALYYDAVLPMMNRVLSFLNQNLSQYFRGEELKINQDNIQILSPDRKEMFDRLVKAYEADILTKDEVRTELGYL